MAYRTPSDGELRVAWALQGAILLKQFSAVRRCRYKINKWIKVRSETSTHASLNADILCLSMEAINFGKADLPTVEVAPLCSWRSLTESRPVHFMNS